MSTVFRPRSKRTARRDAYEATVSFGHQPVPRQPRPGRCRVFAGEVSFVVAYEPSDVAVLVAQNDPASVVGLPTPSGKTEFVRVGHVSRVAPA